MNRERGLQRLQEEQFDVLVVGGGATGLGCALDAAARGYRTGLVERGDFAGETSSRSTKLIHGGVRYLQQGNIALVRQALRERGRLLRNAPGLVRPLPLLVPAYSWPQFTYYACGLRLYAALAGRQELAPTRILARADDAARAVPSLRKRNLRGAIVYWDAQFDDARLAVAIAQTAVDHGAAIANYVCADRLLHRSAAVCGTSAIDCESGERFAIRARAVINATGVFADELRAQDRPHAAPLLAFSRGSHFVVRAQALELHETALLVPRTPDGRVLFALPWHGRVLVGTTDIAVASAISQPLPSSDEIDDMLSALNAYVDQPVCRSDVGSVFAGLRPLVRRSAATTAALSREHLIEISPSGLITAAGGKWTTYRRIAQDAVDAAARARGLAASACRTRGLRLRDVPLVPGDEHAVRHEMARCLEDVLARRRRTLIVDAAQARAQAPAAADVLSRALGRGPAWRQDQLQRFDEVVRRYTMV